MSAAPRPARTQSGFTLLEVLLVTAIGGVVILMISTALSQSLRLWEKERKSTTRDLPFYLDLLRDQVAAFWPVPLTLDKKEKILFTGDGRSFALTTLRSIAGLHGGAPVIARYVYDPEKRRLAYAETPIPGPTHMELAEAFLKAAITEPPANAAFVSVEPGRSGPPRSRFFFTPAESFALSYRELALENVREPWQEKPEKLDMIRVEALSAKGQHPDLAVIYPRFLDFQAVVKP
jgi:prepilin-type N-terminal cleavage/methylation domain-containing protein